MSDVKNILEATQGQEAQNILEWHDGGKMLTEVNATDFITVMKRSGLVVRLTRPTGRVKEVTVHSGDLTQINKSSDGEPAKGYGMWKPEFEDHLFSGKYAIELIPYTESYFKQAEDIKPDALGSDKV